MADKQVLDIVTKKVYRAAKESLGEKLNKVILYGSYARGDFDDDSDIDIITLANVPKNEAWKARMKISKLISGLDLEYDVLISLQVVSNDIFNKFSDSLPFYRDVLKYGVEINDK